MSGIITETPSILNISTLQTVPSINEEIRCKSCGAPKKPFSNQCEYCKTYVSQSLWELNKFGSGIASYSSCFAGSGTIPRFY